MSRLVLVAAEAENRAEADPHRRRAVVAGRTPAPQTGTDRRGKRRPPQRRDARPFQASQTASPKTPTRGRRDAGARGNDRSAFSLARQSGESKAWNASTPRFAGPAEARSPTTKSAKMGLPEAPNRARGDSSTADRLTPGRRARSPAPPAASRRTGRRRSAARRRRLIAASARLKTKKWRPNACRSRKSTTAP